MQVFLGVHLGANMQGLHTTRCISAFAEQLAFVHTRAVSALTIEVESDYYFRRNVYCEAD